MTDHTYKKCKRLCITHLCFAFTLLIFLIGRPFLSDLYEIRIKLKNTAFLLGKPSSSTSLESQDLLKRNAKRFEALPPSIQKNIQNQHTSLQKKLNTGFLKKCSLSLFQFLFKTSPLLSGWIFFSIFITLAFLKQKEGAVPATWLLSLIALCYLFEGKEGQQQTFLPQESYLVEKYAKHPLSKNIFKQRDELLLAWQHYLIQEWAKQAPSEIPSVFQQQLEEGIFAFELNQILKPQETSSPHPLSKLGFFLWNLLFSGYLSHSLRLSLRETLPGDSSSLCSN